MWFGMSWDLKLNILTLKAPLKQDDKIQSWCLWNPQGYFKSTLFAFARFWIVYLLIYSFWILTFQVLQQCPQCRNIFLQITYGYYFRMKHFFTNYILLLFEQGCVSLTPLLQMSQLLAPNFSHRARSTLIRKV